MILARFLALLRKANIALSLDEDGGLLVEDRGGAMSEELLQQIREHKAELVEYLGSLDRGDLSGIAKTAKSETYTLSSAQKRLWTVDQIEKGSVAYNIPNTVGLDGLYDVPRFETAINAVIARHEILRTVFVKDNSGMARQRVLEPGEARFRLLCFDYRGDAAGETKAHEYIEADKVRPFDLSLFPLFNMVFFRLAEERYLLYYNMSHIISDGWSIRVLHRDLLRYYAALPYGPDPGLPVLPIQYKDYAVWEQEQIGGGLWQRQRDYWIDRFRDRPSVPDLPFAGPRPAILTHNGYFLATFIKADVVERMRSFCNGHNGTLFMGLLAVLKVLLYRYTGQCDIIVGTPVSGRNRPELEDQIGFYINTLGLRTQVCGEDSFEELFQKIRSTTLSAYEHQQYPFDRLIEDLKVQRDMSRPILFDIIMILQNQQDREVSGSVVRPEGIIDGGRTAVKFDLGFDFWEEGDGIYMRVDFNADIYDRDSISRLIRHYCQLMTQAAGTCGQRIDELDYLQEEERRQLLETFNSTAAVYPTNKTIPDVFREQVIRDPAHTALVFEDRQLSYLELDQWSDQVAHFLRKAGVNKEALVPVYMERSPEMIVAMLGILKAGAAYVPVDPAYPRERIAYMLADTGASRIIVNRCSETSLFRDLDVIDLHADQAAIGQGPAEFRGPPLASSDLAYVIYTSGSTGKPKGVMIEHGSVMNLIYWHVKRYEVDAFSKSTCMAGIGFDATVLEIWSALLSGSTLHILTDEVKLQSDQLVALYRSYGITHAFVPPVLIPGVVRATRGQQLALRYILIGGDRLQTVDITDLSYTLVNQYGPTESTVMVTDYPIRRDTVTPYAIGRPLSNVRIYILDTHKKLMPVGVTGEIYIGGVQLARGYLHNDMLTADRFIADDFSDDPVRRLYRTGDLGRWRADGHIEYRGRIDGQVKIRGNRVEPGEVEQALLKIEGVGSAIVQAFSDGNGKSFLAAYVVSGQKQTVSALRRQLLNYLPGYMVPEYFVGLDAFPVTANGKIDRSALPDPVRSGMGTGIQYQAPANDIEQALTEIFAAGLHKTVGQIGMGDNFFDLGATSITLIEVAAMINQRFNMELKVVALFQYPTIKDLAEHCFQPGADQNGRPAVEADASSRLDETLEIFESYR